MKFRTFQLLFLTFILAGCANAKESPTIIGTSSQIDDSSNIIEDDNYYAGNIEADYGFHIPDKVTLLFHSALIFFDISEYGYDKLIVGDYVQLKIKGELYILETYPAQASGNYEIEDIKLISPTIVEYTLIEKEDGLYLHTDDERYNQADILVEEEMYVIEENKTFSSINSLEIGSTLYGVNPANYSSLTMVAYYSYLPR